jgi:hypothetical protein
MRSAISRGWQSPLATDPRDTRRSIFIIMASAGLVFLAATTRVASQHLLPAVFRLALVPGSVIEFIRLSRGFQKMRQEATSQ